MKKIAIYPGSFDPYTKGHENILAKALTLFDEIIIAIGVNTTKNLFFTLESRIKHLESIYNNNSNIKIISYSELTVGLCRKYNAKFILRGLRNSSDFAYELPISHTNKQLDSSIETVFMNSDCTFSYIQSTIVREIYKNDRNIDDFVTNPKHLVQY
jgi:pantetheine-phosphate adenylyltransferase